MDRHNEADEDYYIKASKLLELAKNAYILFEKAQIEQKRRLLNFVFQNSTLRGKKLEITAKMPFDTLIECNKTQNWLPIRQLTRTISDLLISDFDYAFSPQRFSCIKATQ